jgi:hypothetical protein
MLKYFKISLGDTTKIATEAEAMTVMDAMVKSKGGGVPSCKPCDSHGNLIPEGQENDIPPPPPSAITTTSHVDSSVPPAPKAPVYSDWGNTVVDQDAKKRIEATHAAINLAGGPKINTGEQFFETGTRMAAEGYATQTKREQDHKNKMLLRDAISQLQERVSNEVRRDVQVSAKDIANLISVEDGDLFIKDHFVREHALRGLVTRLESPALSYLLGLRERINADRVRAGIDHDLIEKDAAKMADTLRYECLRNPDVVYKLRMREFPCDIYAALSPDFGVADAPMVMEQILKSMPPDARGSWEYDPETTGWELRASIWTPVPVAEQAVGEPFEGYVSLSSRDNGTGRFNGGGGINLLRCLNASTYNAGEQMSRTHRGKILIDVNTMIQKSLKAIEALCIAWGKGRQQEVEVPTGVPIEVAMPGFWRSLLREGELAKVLTGRKENHVKELSKSYFEQRRDTEKVVLSDFAQGWTRYIQKQPTEIRREAEQAIGNWVVNPPKEIKCELKEKND